MGNHAWGSRKILGAYSQKKRIMQRDPICRCKGCKKCSTIGCARASTQDDHIIPIHLGGNADPLDDRNHQGLCTTCHFVKSSHEATAARNKYTTQRGKGKHPGLL